MERRGGDFGQRGVRNAGGPLLRWPSHDDPVRLLTLADTPAQRQLKYLIVPLCLMYAIGALLGWGNPTLSLAMGDFGLAAAAAVAAISCLFKSIHERGRARLSWALFAFSATMVSFGNGIWGWYEVFLGVPVPTPGPTDVIFLLFAPPTIVGLLLVAQRPRGIAAWTCMALDGWLIAGSLFTLGWSLALARNTSGDRSDVLKIVLTLAYPVLDILMISMVLGLRFRAETGDRAALNLTLIGLAVTVMSDALWTTPGLNSGYRSGGLLDAGWFAGSLLLAIAPWMGEGVTEHDRPRHRTISMLSALTPYIAAAVCTAGVLGGAVAGHAPDRVVLAVGATVLVALVLRQGITLVDNVFMAQELSAKESHFRSLVQGSSDVIMIAAGDGVLQYVSHAVRPVYGFEPEELVGTRLELLIHPEESARVQRELRAFLDGAGPGEAHAGMVRVECRIRSAGGTWLHTESAVNRYGDGLIFNSRDVTDRIKLQTQLEHDAFHDRLTDLPNRALFEDRIQHALAQRRGVTPTIAVLFLDLDGFKAVNDNYGHTAGDELLVQAARRLEHAVRIGDTVARFGGDEFAALLVGDPSPRAIREIAERLLATLSSPYRIADGEVRVAASIGIAFSAPGIAPADLMRHADAAMYRAKDGGKGRVEVYTPDMDADVERRAARAAGRRRVDRDGRLGIAYQPVVDLDTGRVRHVEATLCTIEDGTVPGRADHVRLTAGVDGRLSPVGRRLLEESTLAAATWRAAGHDIGVTVGLAARQLTGSGFLDVLEETLRGADLSPAALTLEITDNVLPDGDELLLGRIAVLRRLGVRLSLDDFGTGHSSLTYLRRLPVDALKIDRSFVAEVGTCPHLTVLTSTIVRLGLDSGLTLVAAGIDNHAQVDILREMGCQQGQGTWFHPAVSGDAIFDVLGQTSPGNSAVRGPRPEPIPETRAALPVQVPRPHL
ncbi:putative bifunctional diguanylate cyclase/phosphodiesterase [Embleya sp. NBC_00896]|uniref:putative bifunctional diguanylate cyclase/phosphodiesterase n=1 Tax=Embleya sp. NBC_00896 TaxID=2975961 RepID=UPI00386F7CA6|nr:diguanylate cyclase [Embleya sp. NBC_00896]